jgi:flavin reductase (DIM6/NTAB) family NADH-FMN oxidoreductase RutF
MFFDPRTRDKTILPHDPFKALIAPRPIGWVSTMSEDGRVNLAPYSFFNAFSADPALIGFCSEGRKDSLSFALETGEFVWNLVTYDLRMQMSETSAPLPRGESEFAHAGLETAPSQLVRPPRVKASPAHMECKVVDVFQLHDMNGADIPRHLVIGQVIGIHIDDAFISPQGIVEVTRMKPVARCGYQDYSVLDDVFALKRPAGGGNAAGGG